MTTPRIEEIRLKARENMVDIVTTSSQHLEILDQALTEAHQAGVDEAVEVIENISEFNAKLAIEPSRDFLEGAVAMKTFILNKLKQNER